MTRLLIADHSSDGLADPGLLGILGGNELLRVSPGGEQKLDSVESATRVMPNQVELLAARIAPLEPIRFALPQRPGTPEPQAIAKADTTRRTTPPTPGRVPPRAQR